MKFCNSLSRDLVGDGGFSLRAVPMQDDGLGVLFVTSAPVVQERDFGDGEVLLTQNCIENFLVSS
jgi:hypothetical protein